MFSKLISTIMSFLLFISSLLGINIGKENPELVSYNENKTAFSVCIKENPSTGYAWKVEIKNEKVLSLAGTHYLPGPTDVAGASGDRTFIFKGESAGTTSVTLSYERSWEGNPIRVIMLSVKVNSDMTLTAKVASDKSV